MSNTTQSKASPLVEGILDLVGQYGEAVGASHTDTTPKGRHRARLAAAEVYLEIGEALRSGRLATPGLGAELTRRFGLNQDDHLADYGFNPGPTPADLPPYVTVEVVEQQPGRGITLVQADDNRMWVAYGVGGEAPAWLATVPVGKSALARGPVMSTTTAGVWLLTDWVEPAADHCSPLLTDLGNWVIGDDTCAETHHAIYPHQAVELHNAWLHSVLDRPTPAAPVAVSPERVAEICVELNRLNLEGAADAETVYIWNLPELDRVTQRSELNEAYAFMLHGGIAVEFSSAHGWQQVTA